MIDNTADPLDVWDQAEKDFSADSVRKLGNGEKLNHVETQCVLKWNPEALVPSFS